MSDTNNDDLVMPSELDMLKNRAKMMGITFSGNIGLEALKAKITAKMEGTPVPSDHTDEVNPLGEDVADKPETYQETRTRLLRDSLALVRCRITNMDPKKKDLHGEIITVGNDFIGTVKKFIPYGEFSEAGFHMERILFDELNSRKFLNVKTTRKNGQIHVDQQWAKEFSLEVLDQLTQDDPARLAASQAAAAGMAT